MNKLVTFNRPAWHNIGTTFTGPVDLESAFELAGLTYKTEMVKMWGELPTGELLEFPDRRGIVRSPYADDNIYRPLSVVGANYKMVNNDFIIDNFQEISKVWPVDAVGVIKQGKTTFAVLDAGEVEIKGDLIHQYFNIVDYKTGRGSSHAVYTPLRMNCWNQLNAGLKRATLNISVPHVNGNYQKITSISETVEEMWQSMNSVNALFNNMANTTFSLVEFRNRLEHNIYPDPIKQEDKLDVTQDFEKLLADAQERRTTALMLAEKFNDEQPKLANTQWSAWNAITELEDHTQGRGDAMYTSIMFGQRAETKATALSVILGE